MSAPICLLTRPEPQSREIADLLPGTECVISPILRIVPLQFDEALVLSAPGFVFTSANAVPFAGPGRGRPAICVGPQTANAARSAGFQVTEGPGDAQRMQPLLEGLGDWLHLHGQHRIMTLPVRAIAVYDQVAQPLNEAAQHVLSGRRRVILPLFSPRSAKLLSSETSSAIAPITTVAISAQADRAFTGPVRMRKIAAQPERSSVIKAIEAVI
ncbi:uroporphyrinogen-III synthase [Paracoccus sp. SCSIO 75233]|uniref:uroporphyrinogen-III synthase n=1 Tax=Paracoccus sp. SCSIO 75233 TaxID=3017782 RepID=UPI0022F13EB5|nr:uroporphyrinogen-III synthase [Paracoccus sp. SCSIO 75233]WBU53531.1 uroporphyrinogen-III synthase [Paracoccus sp. SCSIO 75233]